MLLQRTFLSVCLLFAISTAIIPGCLTTKKMDQHIAHQYNDQLPAVPKKKDPTITVNSSVPYTPEGTISHTVQKTSKVLPLIVYVHYDYRHTSTLNPVIAVNSFATEVNRVSGRLNQKLNGRQLQLTVEQIPNAFSLVDKAGMILFLVHWDKVYIEPEVKDLVVSYKVLQANSVVKENKIIIPDIEHNKGIRFAQGWKSSSREYLQQYNADITSMSKKFVDQLLQAL